MPNFTDNYGGVPVENLYTVDAVVPGGVLAHQNQVPNNQYYGGRIGERLEQPRGKVLLWHSVGVLEKAPENYCKYQLHKNLVKYSNYYQCYEQEIFKTTNNR